MIFCPKEICSGLVLALHLNFNHASKSQLKKLFDRYFYATGSSNHIEQVVDNCSLCNSIKKVPRELFSQSTSVTTTPGKKLCADVMRRFGQKGLVVRDALTSFTSASFAKDETALELRAALIVTCLPMQFNSSVIKVDCAPALRSLQNCPHLKSLGIEISLGDEKNPNKNAVADKAIQELELEILKLGATPSAISASTLVQAICNLNSRIRHNGLSAKEMFLGRDQVNGQRLRFTDKFLSTSQNTNRQSNHVPSSISKARGGSLASKPNVSVGSLVYVKHEGNKFNPRESYIVVELKHNESVVVQKLNNGKFRSRQYTIPMSRIFPCVNSSNVGKEKEKVIEASSSSSDDDIIPIPVVDQSSDSSSAESDDVDSVISENATQILSPRRSSRQRRSPDRFGNPLSYNSSNALPGENNVTPSWWPGYPRGSFSLD